MQIKLLLAKATFVILTTVCSVNTYSQNLYVSKYNRLVRLNQTNFSPIDSVAFQQNDQMTSLNFRAATNEIYSLFNTYSIFKFNVVSNVGSVLVTLPNTPNTEYSNLMIANNRLFVITRDYNDPQLQFQMITELNINDGTIISSHFLSYGGNQSKAYIPATNSIFISVGTDLLKYNIVANTIQLVGSVPASNSLCAVGNRLFIANHNYQTSQQYLEERNPLDGSIINSIPINISGNLYFKSATYIDDTHEIAWLLHYQVCCTAVSYILKFNIDTNIYSLTMLPEHTFYYGIVSTIESALAIPVFVSDDTSPKILKAYNLLGQEIPVETKNQIIIMEFDNGSRKKMLLTD